MPGRRADTLIEAVAVVVPARNERDRIGRCIDSVVRSLELTGLRRTHLVVVDDGSDDGTPAVARAALVANGRSDAVITVATGRAGAARAAGVAHVRATGVDPGRTWLLSTDADCVVPADWAVRHLAHAEAGAVAVAGVVSLLDDADGRRIRSAWERDYGPTIGPGGRHPHVHAANLGCRLDAHLAVGGFPPLEDGEDTGLWRRLRAAGLRPVADAGSIVATSARVEGRVRHGFAHALRTLYGDGTTGPPPAALDRTAS